MPSGRAVTYSISDNTNFEINSQTGLASNKNVLFFRDHPQSNVTFFVKATDTQDPTLFASTLVTITITGGDDPIPPPTFSQNAYTFTVNKVSQTASLQVSATPGEGRGISYSLLGTSDFTISSGGVISNTDTEFFVNATQSPIIFQVAAYDSQDSNIAAFASVTINIRNQVVQTPALTYPSSILEFTAQMIKGTQSFDVAPTGGKAPYTYTLSGVHAPLFKVTGNSISNISEYLFHDAPLDSYSLAVTVRDSSTPSKTQTANIVITQSVPSFGSYRRSRISDQFFQYDLAGAFLSGAVVAADQGTVWGSPSGFSNSDALKSNLSTVALILFNRHGSSTNKKVYMEFDRGHRLQLVMPPAEFSPSAPTSYQSITEAGVTTQSAYNVDPRHFARVTYFIVPVGDTYEGWVWHTGLYLDGSTTAVGSTHIFTREVRLASYQAAGGRG